MLDKITYVECPDCVGTGEVMVPQQRHWGYSEVMVLCKFCDGMGYLDEVEYIIMKLEGTV